MTRATRSAAKQPEAVSAVGTRSARRPSKPLKQQTKGKGKGKRGKGKSRNFDISDGSPAAQRRVSSSDAAEKRTRRDALHKELVQWAQEDHGKTVVVGRIMSHPCLRSADAAARFLATADADGVRIVLRGDETLAKRAEEDDGAEPFAPSKATKPFRGWFAFHVDSPPRADRMLLARRYLAAVVAMDKA